MTACQPAQTPPKSKLPLRQACCTPDGVPGWAWVRLCAFCTAFFYAFLRVLMAVVPRVCTPATSRCRSAAAHQSPFLSSIGERPPAPPPDTGDTFKPQTTAWPLHGWVWAQKLHAACFAASSLPGMGQSRQFMSVNSSASANWHQSTRMTQPTAAVFATCPHPRQRQHTANTPPTTSSSLWICSGWLCVKFRSRRCGARWFWPAQPG